MAKEVAPKETTPEVTPELNPELAPDSTPDPTPEAEITETSTEAVEEVDALEQGKAAALENSRAEAAEQVTPATEQE